ncbi:MAG: leucine--tRNA ligase [Pseudomonadota bacterium]|nr:leucine--tRNA ligase [Pseudomonadota bacterium]
MTDSSVNNSSVYSPKAIEANAQQYWRDQASFLTTEDPSREKFYCLAMFPYPSGKLHMGHVRNYTITDVIARYQRMLGKNVLHPMGWDAFGLPAENAAIQNQTAPAKWTYQNIDYMKQQLNSLGFSFDWSREFATCEPDYYRWEQWFFGRLYEKGMVYKKMATVNWDPVDCTVLANEQVIDGRGWRSGAIVERKEIPQWFIKITEYADELISSLDELTEWPEQVKTMQKNWIGKSRGADILFSLDHEIAGFNTLPVYTTRPDTLMGVSYLSLAPEHPIALALGSENPSIAEFIAECKSQSVAEADIAVMDKKGIATGLAATHPLSGESIPIWIANYVLMDYGSGAVMAVPAHDERDFAFANRYELPITQVIESSLDDTDFDCSQWQEWYSRKSDTRTINSAEFSGLDFNGAFNAITTKLSSLGKGKVKTNYRLRDWGVSRQRYWGSPIPMLSLPEGGEIPVPADRLPVLLPEDVIMDGVRSPIKADPEWCKTELNGQSVFHETDTFDTFMESSWYYARFTCPDFQDGILDSERANYWLPVDQYVGGIEHAILHLLYARFFHKLLRDDGFVSSNEPFKRLLCQGMVLAESFYRSKEDGGKEWFNPSDVKFERDEKGKILSAHEINSGQAVEIGGMTKMSKSKNNGIDPQTAIEKYGADTVRVFTMFAAPPEQTLEWNDDGVAGAQRFLRRLWTYCNEQRELIQQGKSYLNNNSHLTVDNLTDSAQERRHSIHSSLEKALVDFNKSQFNTVIAACMTILNQLPNHELALNDSHMAGVAAEGTSLLVRLLAPIAPHICHQLWQDLWPEMNCDILCADWPIVDPSALTLSSIEMVVQVNGKVRAKIKVAADANNKKIESLASEDDNVKKFISDKTIRKVIVVPNKLINIVAN